MALGGTNFNLNCSPESQTYHVFPYTIGSGVTKTAGEMALIEDTVGVFVEAGVAGEEITFCYKAERITVPCAVVATGTYIPGSKVYFDATEAEVTETAGSNQLCGIVVKQPSLGDEVVMIDLDGTLGIVA